MTSISRVASALAVATVWLAWLPIGSAQRREPQPYLGAIALGLPSDVGNRRLAEMGFVDVTAAPFHADPSGRRDSSKALQNAIVFARDHQMVTFLPAGTYTVSRTIECLHGRWDPKVGKLRATRNRSSARPTAPKPSRPSPSSASEPI